MESRKDTLPRGCWKQSKAKNCQKLVLNVKIIQLTMKNKFFPSTIPQIIFLIVIGVVIGTAFSFPFLINEKLIDKAISREFTATVLYIIVVTVIILIAYFINYRRKLTLNFSFRLKRLRLLPLLFLVLFSFQLTINLPFQKIYNTLFSIALHNSSYSMVFILNAILIGPLLEEILFRGIILKGLLSNYSPKKAILISAIIFGLIHGQPSMIPGAICFGLLFGYIYYKTHSIGTTILLHAATNLFGIFASYLNHHFGNANFHTITDLYGDYSIVLVVTLFITFIASFWYLFKKESKFNLN